MQKIVKTRKSSIVIDLNRVDFCLFFLITILTPLLLLMGLNGHNPKNWWHSLSAAYYCNTRYLFTGIMLIIASLLFIYNSFIYKLASYSILGLILFPTYEATLGLDPDTTVGIFNLPMILSGNIHIIFNFILLISIILVIIYTIRESKNFKILLFIIPIICSISTIIFETVLHTHGDWSFHWTTIISEWVLFQTAGCLFLRRYFLNII